MKPSPAAGRAAGARAAGALRRHPFRTGWAVCLLAVGSGAAAEPGWTARQIAVSLTAQPARYSELFFTDISALQAVSRPGVAHTVLFTVVNREGRTVRYRYVVTLAAAGADEPAGQGLVTVKDNGRAVVAAHFTPTAANTRFTVTIRLDQPPEAIEFHGRTT